MSACQKASAAGALIITLGNLPSMKPVRADCGCSHLEALSPAWQWSEGRKNQRSRLNKTERLEQQRSCISVRVTRARTALCGTDAQLYCSRRRVLKARFFALEMINNKNKNHSCPKLRSLFAPAEGKTCRNVLMWNLALRAPSTTWEKYINLEASSCALPACLACLRE